MYRKATLVGVAAAALFGAGIVFAQGHDQNKDKPLQQDKPLVGTAGDLKTQCESAIKSKQYLKDLKIDLKEEGSGRIICEGTVPSKVHACALFLTCMSIHGVAQCDLSKLRIEHWAESGIPTDKSSQGTQVTPREKLGTDVQGGLDKGVNKDKSGEQKGVQQPPQQQQQQIGKDTTAIHHEKLSMYAVILNPAEKGVTTTPAGARTFQNDVIVIGDVPAGQLPQQQDLQKQQQNQQQQFPQANPGNQVPNQNDRNVAPQQPVAPNNPGAYPNTNPGSGGVKKD